MRYFSTVFLLVLLLLSGCQLNVVSRADNTKIYATGSACGVDREKAEEAALDNLFKEYPLIAQELKPYVRFDRHDANGTVCYDAVVTKRTWDRYTRTLAKRQEEIVQYLQKQEKVFEYNDKETLIKTTLAERRQFNLILSSAQKLAPVDLEPFSLDYETLNRAINVLPSVAIKVRSCANHSNYRCPVSFIAEVNDESKTLSYLWDFGDGNTSQSPMPKHRFEEEGTYNVLLQVTDESGLRTFRTIDMEISKNRSSRQNGKKNSLTAYFIVSEKAYAVNSDVEFDNRSKSSDSPIISYLWSFGDGQESTLRNPKHRYKSPGKYSVRYKVCNSDGACAYASTNVRIVTSSQQVKPVDMKQKALAIDAKAGEDIQAYIAAHGKPSKQVLKKGTTKAYKFGRTWLLVKHDKIECAVDEEGFKMTLMGQPKKCNWHRRYAKDYMVELQ